jgi:DNA polymerase-4
MDFYAHIRKIIHVDMDAFYASVEQKDRPELKGQPIAVGGSSQRGVVAAASYEARKFGVRSALSSVVAKRNCPELIFVKPRFDRYREISNQIKEIFHEFTDLVEPLSLDEAYLDVTDNKKDQESATYLARDIRNRIYEKTGLHASAGISINKFLAKVASDINKPNGQKTISPKEVIPFLEGLEIGDFHGIGKKTAEKMNRLGIFNGADLKSRSLEFLLQHFGKRGNHYYQIVRGLHLSDVQPTRIRKSVGAERTFSENLIAENDLLEKIDHIADEVAARLKKHQLSGKTITLKIKYSDFTIKTRSITLEDNLSQKNKIYNYAVALLRQESLERSVRLLGITVSNFRTEVREENNFIYRQLKIPF